MPALSALTGPFCSDTETLVCDRLPRCPRNGSHCAYALIQWCSCTTKIVSDTSHNAIKASEYLAQACRRTDLHMRVQLILKTQRTS